MNWLAEHLATCALSPAHEGYCLGRGAKEESIKRIGVVTWQMMAVPPDLEGEANSFWIKKYGPFGEKLMGWLVWPLLSPRGTVIGFAARRTDVKVITRYLLPEAEWNPIWTGMCPETMERIWAGADIWVAEGIFDLFPLEWAAPANTVVLGSERARLTYKHIEFLRRFSRGQVWLIYDNDETGRRGVTGWVDETGKERPGGIDRLRRAGVQCRDVTYRGKDPGEVWKKGGAAAMRAAFSL